MFLLIARGYTNKGIVTFSQTLELASMDSLESFQREWTRDMLGSKGIVRVLFDIALPYKD
jgi:hypothetical protein